MSSLGKSQPVDGVSCCALPQASPSVNNNYYCVESVSLAPPVKSTCSFESCTFTYNGNAFPTPLYSRQCVQRSDVISSFVLIRLAHSLNPTFNWNFEKKFSYELSLVFKKMKKLENQLFQNFQKNYFFCRNLENVH